MTADVRANVRAAAMSPLLVPAARDRKYKRILFKFSKSLLFAPARGAGAAPRAIAIFHRLVTRAGAGESIPVPVLFRIIDVKNILEALINVGREDIREGRRPRRRSSHTPSCYWISIGKRLFLSSDRGLPLWLVCHRGPGNSVSLFVALSRAGSTDAREGNLHISSSSSSSSFFFGLVSLSPLNRFANSRRQI